MQLSSLEERKKIQRQSDNVRLGGNLMTCACACSFKYALPKERTNGQEI